MITCSCSQNYLCSVSILYLQIHLRRLNYMYEYQSAIPNRFPLVSKMNLMKLHEHCTVVFEFTVNK